MPRGVGVRVPLSAQARHFFECRVFADKGTRTDCGGSADLSAYLGVILLRNQLRRVIARLNKFHRSITPHSTLRVIPPISSVCSRSAERSSSLVVLPGVLCWC